MKYIKNIIFTTSCLVLFIQSPCFAQSSQERMEQDLEVMRLVLQEMLSDEMLTANFYIKEEYVKGRGIYFSINSPDGYFQPITSLYPVLPNSNFQYFNHASPSPFRNLMDSAGPKPSVDFIYPEQTQKTNPIIAPGTAQSPQLLSPNSQGQLFEPKVLPDQDQDQAQGLAKAYQYVVPKSLFEVEPKLGQVRVKSGGQEYIIKNGKAIPVRQSHDFAPANKLEEILQTFFIKYGSLATQLANRESITISLVSMQAPSYETDKSIPFGELKSRIYGPHIRKIYLLEMRDIRAYRAGHISKEELLSRIQHETITPDSHAETFNVFGKIMRERIEGIEEDVTNGILKQLDEEEIELYNFNSEDLIASILKNSNNSRPPYAYWPHLGYVYTFSLNRPDTDRALVRNPSFSTKGKYSGLAKIGMKSLKHFKQKEVLELWLEEVTSSLRESIPALMINYGRTLQDIKAGDQLVLKVQIKTPELEERLRELTFQVHEEILRRYNDGQIGFETALRQVSCDCTEE